MPTYSTPGVYIEEKKSGVQPIEGVSTSVAAFVGVTLKGPVNKATLITSLAEFVRVFGGSIAIVPGTQEHYLYYAVRHFFQEGGTTCYVVRTVGYGDVNDAASIQAVSAYKDFSGVQIDGTTAVANAFRVSAINEGKWGEGLQIQVENASRFSLLLAEDVAASATATQISLIANADVEVGSILYLVEQVTGVVKSVDEATNSITFQPGFTAESAPFTHAINDNTVVFSPDMKFMSATNLAAPVNVSTAVTSAAIRLDGIERVTGEKLRAGDILNFVRGASVMVVVKKIVDKVLASGETAMVVEFDPTNVPAFDRTRTRVYARDFDVLVQENGAVVETHTHLSLANTNRRDYLDDRLGPGSGASKLIVARETSGTNAALVTNTAFGALASGNDGLTGTPAFGDDDIIGSPVTATGLYALDTVTDASILVVPNSSSAVANEAMAYCSRRKDLFFVMDVPRGTSDPGAYVSGFSSDYAAVYYPWIYDEDPLTGKPVLVPPSGAVAGSYAQTDKTRGVHKAPAGTENGYLNSAIGIERIVTKAETDILYQKKVNVIRKFPEGILIWGTRTLSTTPEWRYVNVRRLFIFLEGSIERGLQWVVFEPNDYGLWKSIKRNVSAFLRVQWQEGKLVGAKEEQAFFVRCDEITNPPDTVDVGQVIAEIGVAPSKPAEFVVFRFKQFAGGAK